MHELGVLRHAMKTVTGIAEKNNIKKLKHITLEVGTQSDFVPMFLEKLFPVAADGFPVMQGAELRLEMVPGTGLQIKEIGY